MSQVLCVSWIGLLCWYANGQYKVNFLRVCQSEMVHAAASSFLDVLEYISALMGYRSHSVLDCSASITTNTASARTVMDSWATNLGSHIAGTASSLGGARAPVPMSRSGLGQEWRAVARKMLEQKSDLVEHRVAATYQNRATKFVLSRVCMGPDSYCGHEDIFALVEMVFEDPKIDVKRHALGKRT